jgi:hypothetical protein
MLSLLPQYESDSRPAAYAEAVSRLASVRHALRLVDGGLAAGPEGDRDEEIASAWPEAGEGRQRCFERRSARLVGTTATGIEALLAQRHDDREPHAAASTAMVDEIRRELREVAGIILR